MNSKKNAVKNTIEEISIFDFENLYFGNFDDEKNGTGVSVITSKQAFACGIDIRGGGPASRETHLLNTNSAAEKINAVVLAGGSAFGLDCAGGVMKYLEEKDIGFETGVTKVPLVCTSCIFDLQVANKNVRPDFNMGYSAAKNAFENNFLEGNHGCGTGATVGKVCGAEYMTKSGIGAYALKIGDLKAGAIVCTNALGEVFDSKKIIAGMLNKEKNGFESCVEKMYDIIKPDNPFVKNTTIGAVFTNAKFDKAQLNKLAAFASNALVRRIRPVNTTADGDTMYAISAGDIQADINVCGMLMQKAAEKAIVRSVMCAKEAYSLKCASSFNQAKS